MSNTRYWRPRVFLAVLLATAAPSNMGTAAQLEVDSASAEEIALVEELAGWLEPDPAASPTPLRQAIRERTTSFDVFRSFHGTEARAAQLRGVPYADAMGRAARRHGVDPLLLAAIVEVESRFDPRAVSHRGALGLMQVMPATAGAVGREELVEPERNLDIGARYLRRLLERFGGDLELVLAAYNAGPTNVRRYGGLPPFGETRRYVEKVLGIYVAHYREVWRTSGSADRLAAS